MSGERDGPRHDEALPWNQTQPHDPPAVYNDPPTDSLFERISESDNRCLACGGITSNNTEGRDGHLNKYDCLFASQPPREGETENG